MKKLAIASVLALATAGSAFAFTGGVTPDSPAELNSNYRATVLQLVPDADLSNLTIRQVAMIETFLANSDNRSSGSNPAGYIQNVLGQS
jgi:hypothetical protein